MPMRNSIRRSARNASVALGHGMFAPGLKTLDDATNIRGRILLAFEEAERELGERKLAALMTFVVVGAGPTGVELAGTIAELAPATLPASTRERPASF
jgi:NADH:ubiquinone reductase (H+-translocating)